MSVAIKHMKENKSADESGVITGCYGHKINLTRVNDQLIREARNQQQRQEYV